MQGEECTLDSMDTKIQACQLDPSALEAGPEGKRTDSILNKYAVQCSDENDKSVYQKMKSSLSCEYCMRAVMCNITGEITLHMKEESLFKKHSVFKEFQHKTAVKVLKE